METLAKTLIIGWDSRWIFKPVTSLVAFSGNLCNFASMLDEIASVVIGVMLIFITVRGVVYQYRYITLPEIKNFSLQ